MFNIEWEDLLNKNNTNIIDIRDNFKYVNSHVFGAVNINRFELENYPYMHLKKDEIYYIYCDNGLTSKRVVYTLNRLGYNTVNINGGFYNYLFRE